MLRYLALIWNPRHESADKEAAALERRLLAGADPWTRIVASAGLHVFATGAGRPGSPRPRLLVGHAGVVLGDLFATPRTGHDSSTSIGPMLDAEESGAIVDSAGKHLIDRYWGSYVAIFQDRQSKAWTLHSPAGSLPCLRASSGSVQLVFSYTPDAIAIHPGNFSINWSFIAKYLLTRHICIPQTGLNEITEVRCGECAEFEGPRISTHQYWDPIRIAAADQVDDTSLARGRVAATTRMCVHAWASTHESVLHNLSGGLDSSIVLSCLADAPHAPRVTAVNYFSGDAEGDERRYARLAAAQAGCALVETRLRPAFNMEATLHGQPTERPQGYFGHLEFAQLWASLARDTGAGVLFSGQRGDEMFFKGPARLAAVDSVLRHGLRSPYFRAVLNAAELSEINVWKVAQDSLSRAYVSRKWGDTTEFTQAHSLIADGIGELLRMEDVDRWSDSPYVSRVLPGKRFHTIGITEPERTYYPEFEAPGQPMAIAPLVSQPLMELLLQIPTYVLTAGGWDRALARDAFTGKVPDEILRRRSKGGMDGHLDDILKRNNAFIRSMLLDGALAREGILDRRKLEEALSGRPSGLMKGVLRLFQYLCIETWLHIWEARRAQLAA